MRQQSLFALDPIGVDDRFAHLKRIELSHGAWVDYVPSWVSGHEALFDELERESAWKSERRVMYERMVDVPRLFARPGAHPFLDSIAVMLSTRYRLDLTSITLAYYRDGTDSVAMHGDRCREAAPARRSRAMGSGAPPKRVRWGEGAQPPREGQMGRLVDDTIVATVSLGAPRRFTMRAAIGAESRAFSLGFGDLLVMGGTCQRTWRHGVPKVAHAHPRISAMFRPEVPADVRTPLRT